ncbi:MULTISPECIES: hypothetical protein [unclassified Nonomuraea]|uniref:hypothetical protein n=1 Tax=unclassified Nonomuraea TaxID=2593643 RepID=UPI0035C0A318
MRRTRLFAFLLACILLSAGAFYLGHDDEPPSAAPEWNPGPFDPPVQYAFIPENTDCHNDLTAAPEESAEPAIITCSEWRLHVNYTLGEGRQDLDITYGAGCSGADAEPNECSSDVQLPDAVSQFQVDADRRRQTVRLAVTPDGHFIAYFSKSWMRYVAWDLRTGQRAAISPRLDAKALADVSGVEISPDGRFFAVAFTGARPRLLLTEFATARTATFPGFCGVLGLSRAATATAAHRVCLDAGEDDPAGRTMTLLNRQGATIGEWTGGEFTGSLSPDGRRTAEVLATYGEDGQEHLVLRDAGTGKVKRKLGLRLLSEPSDAIAYGWLDDDEFLVQADTPESVGSFGYYAVNVRTGRSARLEHLPLDLGAHMVPGKLRVEKQRPAL